MLMTVTKETHITISLNQPDTRMESKQMGKAKFEQLYVSGAGYDEHIGFSVFRGSGRKVRPSTKGTQETNKRKNKHTDSLSHTHTHTHDAKCDAAAGVDT
jgi:hypothetical protein